MIHNTKNSSTKVKVFFILLGFFGVILFSFDSFKKDYFEGLNQVKFDFTGTNSLFIEIDKAIHFNWITENNDIGFYELLDANNSIISKGKTELGRVHSISIDLLLTEKMTFRFGGENESRFEVNLRPVKLTKKSVFKNVDSLFVVGDVHGRYDQLINLLQKSNVIDKELNWIAGRSNLVFLGDLFDRGDDVTKVLWFIYELEQKAEEAGGKVHLVLGNHEIMTMSNDLRYLGAKESTIAKVYKIAYDYMFHPTKSLLGKWLLSKPSVLKIDKSILAHGGVVDLGTNSIEEFNETVYNLMKDPIFLEIMKDEPDSLKYDIMAWKYMRYFFYNEDSPFWYRGYVYYDTLQPQLNKMLQKYDSKVHIVAHTPLHTITQRYKGKLLTTDLNEAATELLLLVRKKNKYARFKIDSNGRISKLN